MTDNFFRVYNKAEFLKDPIVVFNDWAPFCQNVNGAFVKTTYVNRKPALPRELQTLRRKLRRLVPDENTMKNSSAPFNGPSYYLRRVTSEIRRFGEKSGCELEFGPSDYRTFLITHGMDRHWAHKIGIGHLWKSPSQWRKKWVSPRNKLGFFENSFGVNAIVTALGEKGERYCLFSERSNNVAVSKVATIGSIDEGVRRRYKDRLFDQISESNPAPDIEKALYRGLYEEIGLTHQEIGVSKPILLSVGRVISIYQSAALYYLPLEISTKELMHCVSVAQDQKLECSKIHLTPFNKKSICDFIVKQYDTAPVATWVAVMALYALKTEIKKTPRVFISYSHKDRRFVNYFAKILNQHGVFVWIDEGEMHYGDLLAVKLAQAINEMDYVFAIVSQNSVKSEWVERELNQAITEGIEGKKIKVIPIRKDDCKLPSYLTGILSVNMFVKHRRKEAIVKLLRTITKKEK